MRRPPEAVQSNQHGETTIDIDGVAYTVRRMKGNVPGNSYAICIEGKTLLALVDLDTNDPLAVTWAVRGWLAGIKHGTTLGRYEKGREVAETLNDLLAPN